jgi:hypothetical protein
MTKTLKENTFQEETYTAEEFSVKKTIGLHELYSDCYVIRMLVFDGSKKKVAELEAIVHRDE